MLPVGGQTGEQDKAQGDLAGQCSCLLWNSLVKGDPSSPRERPNYSGGSMDAQAQKEVRNYGEGPKM